jgi:hypothetical protein
MDWGSVAGSRIVSGSVGIPYYGAFVADVELVTTTALPSIVSVTLGNLTLAGAVYRQSQFAGKTLARLVGGAGGWSQTVQARFWRNTQGLMASTVLRDTAIDAGEKVNLAADFSVGVFWTRRADKASRVLARLAGPEWWIDSSGTTQIGARSSTVITSAFQLEEFDGARGLATVATEDLASWMPGNTFSNDVLTTPTMIASVRHSLSGDGVARLQVMTR